MSSIITEAAQKLIDERKAHFPNVPIMDALGVLYPQYWLQGDCDISFCKHLKILQEFYGEPKWLGKEGHENRKLIPPMLDRFKLDDKQLLFKVAMIHNVAPAMEPPPLCTPPDQVLNPLTKLWRSLDANSSLSKSFLESISNLQR